MSDELEAIHEPISLIHWCKDHVKIYTKANCNMEAVGVKITNEAIQVILDEGQPESIEDVGRIFTSAAKLGKPLCCYLSDDRHLEILADAPADTGDPKQNAADAEEFNPESRRVGGRK